MSVLQDGGAGRSWRMTCVLVRVPRCHAPVSYLTGERDRLRHSFVDFATDPNFGGWTWLLRGKGYFNVAYIYGDAPERHLPRPYDFARALQSDVEFRICSTRADNGDPVYWGREDVSSTGELMAAVRASSTIPLAMPVPRIDGGRGGLDGAPDRPVIPLMPHWQTVTAASSPRWPPRGSKSPLGRPDAAIPGIRQSPRRWRPAHPLQRNDGLKRLSGRSGVRIRRTRSCEPTERNGGAATR